jgi:ubiquinone/menaquinone biosynthesis C-methylase UbiE
MEALLEQISQQQKETWNKFSMGWRKWDDLAMNFMKPVGDEIIRLIKPKSDDYVLDIASGTGEPGLTIAKMLNRGKVVFTDISDGMLESAKDNAVKRGIRNIETRVCDVSDLPFEDNIFDAISCRFGYMFFPDMSLATREIYRVLKPGGRIATSVWNVHEKNFWVTAIMEPIKNNIQLPPVPEGAPGMFRCAQNGLMSKLFKDTGLKNIYETEIHAKLNAGTFDTYWNFMTEVVAPAVAALSQADEDTKANIKCEVYSLLKQKFPDGNISPDASTITVYGEK